MADTDKHEETTEKKRGLLGGSKVPLDAVLLVVVPFVTFLVLFMYVMGLLPPRPMTVKVVGASPLEQGREQETTEREEVVPTQPPVTADDARLGFVAPEPEGASPLSQSTDSLVTDGGGMEGAAQAAVEAISEQAGEGEAAEVGAGADIDEIDQERVERIKQLAKVYEQMNASSVAAIVTNMDDDDAVDILSNMKPRNAAKVLASLDPEKAAVLSLQLTEGGK